MVPVEGLEILRLLDVEKKECISSVFKDCQFEDELEIGIDGPFYVKANGANILGIKPRIFADIVSLAAYLIVRKDKDGWVSEHELKYTDIEFIKRRTELVSKTVKMIGWQFLDEKWVKHWHELTEMGETFGRDHRRIPHRRTGALIVGFYGGLNLPRLCQIGLVKPFQNIGQEMISLNV